MPRRPPVILDGADLALRQAMETPLQITFRGFNHTPEVEALIRKRATELEKVAGHRLTSCHVVVELDHKHIPGARMFHARIDLSLPGGVIATNREPHDQHPHEDVNVAVRDAFDAAHHQVEEWERRHHGAS
jgi:putative sigma-54 modulation protein